MAKENLKKDRPKKDRSYKDTKIYEFRVYTTTSVYAGDVELLVTLTSKFKDIIGPGGRVISQARGNADEYARNIGMFGLTVEDPEDTFVYYAPHRIFKVEYNEVDDD